MRIAFVNHNRRKVGGAEVYLDSVIPAFARSGHEIACLLEDDFAFAGREPITIPDGIPTWSAATLGRQRALDDLKAWHPDVCFTHGLRDIELETEIVALGNSAL